MSFRTLICPLLLGAFMSSLAPIEAQAQNQWTRCKHNARFKAEQIGGQVVIVAFGNHPTSGYKSKLRKLPIEIYPPQFEIVEQKPNGIVLQVLTPFAEFAIFKAPRSIPSIVIYDGNGKHTVKVTSKKSVKPVSSTRLENLTALIDKSFLTKDGKLTERIVYKVSQSGFAGVTGFFWTIEPDGSWTRRSFINRTVRKVDSKGKLTAKQLQQLATVLSKNQARKLPLKLGSKPMVNPRIVSLTVGKRESKYIVRGGTNLPKPKAAGKTEQDRFLRVVSTIQQLLKTGPKGR
jgi:hypothetical protein